MTSDLLNDVTAIPAFFAPETSGGDEKSAARPVVAPTWTGRVPVLAATEADQMTKKLRAIRQRNGATRDRLVDVRLIMAWLEGVSIDDVAILLDVRPERVPRWLREEESIPGTKHRRIKEVAELLIAVRQLVAPSALSDWLHLSLTRLDGASPIVAIAHGRMPDVLAVARAYSRTSFK